MVDALFDFAVFTKIYTALDSFELNSELWSNHTDEATGHRTHRSLVRAVGVPAPASCAQVASSREFDPCSVPKAESRISLIRTAATRIWGTVEFDSNCNMHGLRHRLARSRQSV